MSVLANANGKLLLCPENYSVSYLLLAGFLFVLFYDPEIGSDMFLRNFG
jgi:hypothetical protein